MVVCLPIERSRGSTRVFLVWNEFLYKFRNRKPHFLNRLDIDLDSYAS